MTFYYYANTAVLGDDEPPPTPPTFWWVKLNTGDTFLVGSAGSFVSVSGGIDGFWIDSNSESVRATIDGLLYAERNAIYSLGHFADISVNGHVIGNSTGIHLENRGELHVGIGGTVEGGTGVELTDSTLFNDGTVTGNAGVRLNSGIIYNNGVISSAGQAIYYFGADALFPNTVVNTGTIQGDISTFTDDVTALTINNSGAIAGHISLGDGGDIIVNSGTISGFQYFSILIDLGEGNNSIDSRGGHIYGDIRTGDGNDTILLGDEDNLVTAGAGHDVIDGGGGINTILYETDLTGGVRVNLANGTAKGGDAGGDTLTHFQNVTGTAFRDVLTGDDGNNVLDGFFGHDTLNGNGGNDTLKSFGGPGKVVINGGDGNDTIVMVDGGLGAAFTAAARVDGGAGYDTLTVSNIGNLTLTAQTLVNVENIQLLDGASQSLTTNNGNVANGKMLEVDASALIAGHNFTFNGSAETNGTFDIDGGAGNDTIVAGAGADTIIGHLGGDTLTGGGGADTFVYSYVNDSLFSSRDRVTDFNAGVDKFLLYSEVTGFDGEIIDANVSSANNLRDAVAGQFHAGHFILVNVSQGSLAGHELLVIDVNGSGGYQQSADMVIDVTGVVGALSTADFIVA